MNTLYFAFVVQNDQNWREDGDMLTSSGTVSVRLVAVPLKCQALNSREITTVKTRPTRLICKEYSAGFFLQQLCHLVKISGNLNWLYSSPLLFSSSGDPFDQLQSRIIARKVFLAIFNKARDPKSAWKVENTSRFHYFC